MKLFLLILLSIVLFAGCATMHNTDQQRLVVYADEADALVHSNGTYLGKTNYIGYLPRKKNLVLAISKPGFENEEVRPLHSHTINLGSTLLATSLSLVPFLILPSDPSYAAIQTATIVSLSTVLLGGILFNAIDAESGADFAHYPDSIYVTLTPELTLNLTKPLSVKCNYVDYNIQPTENIGTMLSLSQFRNTNITLNDYPEINANNTTAAIHHILAKKGFAVTGKNFNTDTSTELIIQLIIDSISIDKQVWETNDRVDLPIIIDGVPFGDATVNKGQKMNVFCFSTLHATWKLINQKTQKEIVKSYRTEKMAYQSTVLNNYLQNIRANLHHFLNDAAVKDVLLSE